MTALEPPALQDRPAIGGTRAAPEAVYAHPASLFRLIGTFRHNYTSLLSEIIGVPKFGVKETITKPIRTCLISAYIGHRPPTGRGKPPVNRQATYR